MSTHLTSVEYKFLFQCGRFPYPIAESIQIKKIMNATYYAEKGLKFLKLKHDSNYM